MGTCLEAEQSAAEIALESIKQDQLAAWSTAAWPVKED